MYEKFTDDDFTDRARDVLKLATREAERLGDRRISTEHLLLALIKEGASVAVIALKEFIDMGALRKEVLELLGKDDGREAEHRD